MTTWTRSELKEKAKSGLHHNYWKSVLAGLLLIIALGAGGAVSSGLSLPDTFKTLNETRSITYQEDSGTPGSDGYWEDWSYEGGARSSGESDPFGPAHFDDHNRLLPENGTLFGAGAYWYGFVFGLLVLAAYCRGDRDRMRHPSSQSSGDGSKPFYADQSASAIGHQGSRICI